MDFCVNIFSPTEKQVSKNLSWFENKNLLKINFYWKKGFELIQAIFFSLGVCAKNICSYFVAGKQEGGRGVPEKKSPKTDENEQMFPTPFFGFRVNRKILRQNTVSFFPRSTSNP